MPQKNQKGNGKTESLFMIEFLVDKCVIFQRSLPRKLRTIPGDTCLGFSILGQPPIEISECDFMSCVTCAAPCEVKKNGKSALFALTPEDCKELKEDFNVNITVHKKYFCPFLPEKMQIGFLTISLKKKFAQLMKSLKRASKKAKMVTQEVKGKMINGMLPGSGCCVGEVDLFIRISCFGKTIVTGFTMNIPENSIFFQDNDGTNTYKYIKPKTPRNFSTMSSCCTPQFMGSTSYNENGMSSAMSEDSCKIECGIADTASGDYEDEPEDKFQSVPRFPKCTYSAPCQSQPCGFPPCTFPPCDIIIPPPLPKCDKLPKTIVACGVKPTLMSPCDQTCGIYPCGYVPCEPIGCGGCGIPPSYGCCGPPSGCPPTDCCGPPPPSGCCGPPPPSGCCGSPPPSGGCRGGGCCEPSQPPSGCCGPPPPSSGCCGTPCGTSGGCCGQPCGSICGPVCDAPCGRPCSTCGKSGSQSCPQQSGSNTQETQNQGSFPCSYPCYSTPCLPAGCGTCRSPCGYPCNWYPYGLPPCGTAPCGLLADGEPPCGASCGSPPYGVPPCRPRKPKPTCGPPCTGPCNPYKVPCGAPSYCGGPCGSKPCLPAPCFIPCGQPDPCGQPCGPPDPCGQPCAPPFCGPPLCGQPCGSSCGQPCGPACGLLCGLPCGQPCGPPCGTPTCGPIPCGPFPSICGYPCKDPPIFCDASIVPVSCNPYPAGYPVEPVPNKRGVKKFPKPCSGTCGNTYCKDLLICGYPCGVNMDMDRCMPAPEFVTCRPCQMVKKQRIKMSKVAAKQFEMMDRQRRLMSGELGSNAPKKKYPKMLK